MKKMHGRHLFSPKAIALSCVYGMLVSLSAGADPVTLVYAGADGGNWSDANVWRTADGQLASWSDGSYAVISNVNVKMTGDVSAYGLEFQTTSKKVLNGSGVLTLGAGGLVNSGTAEINIQNSGGIHLSVSQEWKALDQSTARMICLDVQRPVTAEPNVVLTVTGNTQLRWNAAGQLHEDATVRILAPASLSPSSGTTPAFGSCRFVMDGAGTRAAYGSQWDSRYIGNFGQVQVLRNGADIALNNYQDTPLYLALPSFVVEGTGSDESVIYGGPFCEVQVDQITFDVAEGNKMNVSVPFREKAGVSARFVKTGAGLLTLSSSSACSGGWNMQGGTLAATSVAALGTGPLAVASGAALQVPGAGTIVAPLTGTGRIAKTGAGVLNFVASTDWAGSVQVDAGTLRIGAVPTGASTIAGGATLALTSSATLDAGARALLGTTGLVLAGSNTVLTLDAFPLAEGVRYDAEPGGRLVVPSVSGSGWTVSAGGTVAVASLADYAGELVVAAGVLEIPSTASIPDGATIRTTGTGAVRLMADANPDYSKITGTCRIALASEGTISLNTDALPGEIGVGADSDVSVVLSGSKDLVTTGLGRLRITSAADFTGRIIVNGATLALAGPVLSSSDVIISNGTFAVESGAELGAVSVRVCPSGTLALWDAAGLADIRLTLAGGTVAFRATTTLPCDVLQTGSVVITAVTPAGADEPVVGTIGGFISTASTAKQKLDVRGENEGRVVFAGGGSFPVGNTEIFVTNQGRLTVVSNEVTVASFWGIEENGSYWGIAEGGSVRQTSGVLHAGYNVTNAVFEVAEGGTLTVAPGSTFRVGIAKGHCTLRVSGLVDLQGSGNFQLSTVNASDAPGYGTIELLSGGVLRTARPMRLLNPGWLVFRGGTLQCLLDSSEFIGTTNAVGVIVTTTGEGGTLDTDGHALTIGRGQLSGDGTLTVTGGGSAVFSQPAEGWTGTLVADGATVGAQADDAFGTGRVQVCADGELSVSGAGSILLPCTVELAEGGVVRVADGVTATVAAVDGPLLKDGDGTLASGVFNAAANVMVRGGGVAVSDAILGAPAGVPAFWVDASASDSLGFASGNQVQRWNDCRQTAGGPAYLYATNRFNRPLLKENALNGRATLDFGKSTNTSGSGGDNRMMQFAYLSNIRTVFWVIGSQNGGCYLLGDSQAYNGSSRWFHRGGGLGWTNPADAIWARQVGKEQVPNGTTWLNGTIVDGERTGLSGAYDLVGWRLSESDDAINSAAGACWFASCYADGGGRLNGGQELGEVLIYTNRLTDAEVEATTRYLSRKWFPTNAFARVTLGTVTLAGTGTSFRVNGALRTTVEHLVMASANVAVEGNDAEHPLVVNEAVVAADGAWNSELVRNVQLGSLVFENGSTLDVTVLSDGTAACFTVAGDVVLPGTVFYRVTVPDGLKPQGHADVLLATGSVSGAPVWRALAGTRGAFRPRVDAASRVVRMSFSSGTIFYLR